MTDKELLEKAAKATGRKPHPIISGAWSGDSFELMKDASTYIRVPTVWNPLTDDGDALRLAVKCGINPIQCIDSVDAMHFDSCIVETEMFEDHGGDKSSATRRAITRAAAAMVKE